MNPATPACRQAGCYYHLRCDAPFIFLFIVQQSVAVYPELEGEAKGRTPDSYRDLSFVLYSPLWKTHYVRWSDGGLPHWRDKQSDQVAQRTASYETDRSDIFHWSGNFQTEVSQLIANSSQLIPISILLLPDAANH